MDREPVPVNADDYDLADAAIYQWKIWKPKRSLAHAFFMLLFMAVVIPALPFTGLYLIHLASADAAIYAAWAFVGVAIFTIVVLFVVRFTGSREERIKNATGLFAIASFSIGAVHFLLAFGGSALTGGFRGADGATSWDWAVYLCDNLLGVVLLDVPDVYNWHISGIRAESHFACFITVLVRVLMTIGLVEMIIALYRTEMQEEEFYGTVRECVHYCDAIIGSDDLVLMRTGAVTPAVEPPVVRVPEFIRVYKAKLT